MASWQARSNRLIARYRLIFRVGAASVVLGLLLAGGALYAALTAGASADMVSLALLLSCVGALNAYKAVASTVKIMERQASEGYGPLR